MKTKRLIIVLFALLSFSIVNSQTVLLEQTVNENPDIPKWGKNYRHYGYFYTNFGIFAGPSKTEYVYGLSNTFAIGFRYKLKLSNHYAIGADLSLSTLIYKLKDDFLGVVPFYVDENNQKLLYQSSDLELYQRINFGKRGNYIGNYFDIGVYAGLNFNSQYIVKYQQNSWAYNEIETTYKDLSFINNYSYGIKARLGLNHWAIFTQYRLSSIILDENIPNIGIGFYSFPELPRFQIGIELGLF